MPLSEEDRLTAMAAMVERGPIRATRELRWVQSLADSIERLATGNDRGQYVEAVFWIRLHGLLTEILPKYLYARELGLKWGIADSIATIKSALSREELVYAQYRRDGQAHVFEEAYELSVKKKSGTLKTSRRFGTIDETLSHSESDALITTVIRAHNSELDIAVSVATKIRAAVRSLVLLFERFNRPD